MGDHFVETDISTMFKLGLLVIGFLFAATSAQSDHLPVVLWHGMGDSCCLPFSMGYIMGLIEDEYPGIYIHSLEIGNGIIEDTINGFFSNMNKVVDEVCETLANDPQLQNGFNAIGFSQGSQFLRAALQRCGGPKMNNLISIGGQQQGVYGFPGCPGAERELCDIMRELLSIGAYIPGIQKYSVQAQYWHDPLKEDDYRELSMFLADINQETYINETYKDHVKSLETFVMVRFNQDSMVQPVASQWFGYYVPGQAVETQTLQESTIYIEDKLGLKELDEAGKLHFLELDGDHLQFSAEWFIENIVKVYL